MARAFLPKIPRNVPQESSPGKIFRKDYERGVEHLEYLRGPKGYKAFQKLVEDMSPYVTLPSPPD